MTTLLVLAVITSAKVFASEIYHWVDESGVSHFSQQPPDRDTPNVSTQKIQNTAPSGASQGEDIYNTKAHEERMAEWRAEREQERQDARDRKNQANSQQSIRYQQPESYGRQPYLYPPIYRPHPRPPYNPERPIFNPRPPTTSLNRGG
ncbi:MAG: DUF4124 domain-containing protein [Xanthomonadales bacterium]|nr:DUF4124 domain-containing protein [Xanthomonadales bacterium]